MSAGDELPLGKIELEPLEAHVVALRAELGRTQVILLLSTAAALVGTLAVLYAAKSLQAPVSS